MTNSWTDIGNASFVLVMGANPSENHPAVMNHINIARAKGAKLIVVDPRKTRTALQADQFVRIRPGTDIAFINAMLNYIIAQMEDTESAYEQSVKDNFFAFLNHVETADVGPHPGAVGRPFWSDNGTAVTAVLGRPVFTDARFIVDASGMDYERETFSFSAKDFSDFPKLATSITQSGVNTVYKALKSHVAPYTLDTAAAICGCNATDIVDVANAFIENSRCSSGGTFGSQNPTAAGYKCTTMLYAMGQTQHTYGAQNVKAFTVIQTLMGNMGRAGGGINALRGIHNVQGSTDMGLLYGYVPGYSNNPTQMPGTANASGEFVNANGQPTNDPNAFGKYMNGLWGHPVSGTGNHASMDGSYDDAYLPGSQPGSPQWWQQTGYFNMVTKWFGPYDSTGAIVPQFNGRDGSNVVLTGQAWTDHRNKIDGLYALWPKTNGDDHISMFRAMGAGTTKALVCWGQNPAVTEPNQTAIREGLRNLELLVVTDMFETETGACDRKPTGVTYLIPACSHVEEAGSVTNSARTLQWREKAVDPKGNSKSDIELLLRFAKALDAGGAFQHIEDTWTRAVADNGLGLTKGTDFTSVYASLYGRLANGWDPTGATPFEEISESIEMWRAKAQSDRLGLSNGPRMETVKGSEVVAEHLCREYTSSIETGGTLWLYTAGFSANRATQKHTGQADWLVNNRAKSRVGLFSAANDPNSTLAYPGWGYSWLVNRRVLYNNGEVTGDVADYYMGPDSVARLFVSTNTSVLNYSRWYRKVHNMADAPDVTVGADGSWGGGNQTSPHFVTNPAGGKYTLAGRFPAHTEPYESPKDAAFLALWGRNTKFSRYFNGTDMDQTKNKKWNLVKDSTKVYAPDDAAGQRTASKPADIVAAAAVKPAIANPLVLTTIRCVEHFQGGPITRNNSYNVEAEPTPWIEINSADAVARGIVTGQMVNVYTARGNSVNQGANRDGAIVAQGFIARVGVGLESQQRVGRGTVAIPWHWGDRGLSTGSLANQLCIDSSDANSAIPEYKACLCWIKKA